MRDVCIIGVGETKVGEHWEQSLAELGVAAARAALKDARGVRPTAVHVGNMLSGRLGDQQHLGALFADQCGLRGAEAISVEAACASGMAALRTAYAAIASGSCDAALVIGAEKMTDRAGPEVTSALAAAADAEFEVLTGVSFVALNALLMRRYLHEFGAPREAFGEFVVNAHDNAVTNPSAMFGYRTSIQDYLKAKPIADPINLLDSAPVCDGAAALVLCSEELARAEGLPAVRIRAVEVATDTLAVHDRHDPLTLRAAALSSSRAFERAALRPEDMDVLELHDAFSIMAVLSLEANGFAERGRGWKLGLDGSIRRNGRLPISTLGGLKARGHPVGATGVYQVSELTRQLRGEAGENQIPRARLGMAQSIGGSGATVVTTILESTL